MSVWRPKKGRYWHYDFQYQGRRYFGSTGATTKKAAERVEQAKRLAAATGELNRPVEHAIPTLGEAAAAWWETKADQKDADTTLSRATRAAVLVGNTLPVNEVTFAHLHAAIQKRRSMLVRGRAPANATVNREIIATMRPTIRLARKLLNSGTGGSVPFPEIDWQALTLGEPKPRPRALNSEELPAVIGKLPAYLQDFARFQARYGPRLSEMFFSIDAVDLAGARVFLGERKGGDDHYIPLVAADVVMLANRIARARAAGLRTPWFRETARGKLKPVARRTAMDHLRKAMTDTGLRRSKGAKGSHNLRHTAAVNILRSSGNLRIAQKLLGHASINSTLVYAHAMEDDLRTALEQQSQPSPEPTGSNDRKHAPNSMKVKRIY